MSSLSDVNLGTVGRYALSAGGAGLTAGALMEVLHQLRVARRLAETREPVDPNKGTLVLDLPNQATKQANNPETFVASMLAALLAGGAGMHVAGRVGRSASNRMLDSELERARTEFLDKLSPRRAGPELKMAYALSAVEEALCGPSDKEAQSPFNVADKSLGTAMLLSLLLAGGSAYASKSYYDQKLDAERDSHFKTPKITRVVFRAPAGGADDVGADAREAHELAKAAVCVHALAVCGAGLLDDPLAKAAAAEDGVTSEEFDSVIGAASVSDDKVAQAPGGDLLVSLLERAPGLRGYALNKGIDRLPMLKGPARWAVNNVPGVRGLAERYMYRQLRERGLSALAPTMRAAAGAVGSRAAAGAAQVGDYKHGGLGPALLAAFAGSEISERNNAAPPVQAQQEPQEPPVLAAEGATAEQFLAKNRKRIELALAQLARDGALSAG